MKSCFMFKLGKRQTEELELCLDSTKSLVIKRKRLILLPLSINMLLSVMDPVWELDIPSLIPCILLSSPVQ